MTRSLALGASSALRLRRLAAAGAAAAVVGAAGVCRAHWHRTSCRLFDAELDLAIADAGRRIEAARIRKRRHDLVNAFTAVEGAALIIARESLSAPDRATLTDILGAGLSRLRVLILDRPVENQVVLAELAASVADEPGWNDRLHIDVPPGLTVAAPPGEIAESLRQLLIHATSRAPSSPMTVRAVRNADRVELWVDDLGPRLSISAQRHIGHPGRRSLLGTNPVSALDVAIRLARAQGGHVLARPRPERGQSIGISWPVCVV